MRSAGEIAHGLRGLRPVWLAVTLLILVASAVAIIAVATGSADQPGVSAAALPAIAGARKTAVYVDCSKVSSVAYFSDNPCQTFVLLESDRFASAERFLAAETSYMMAWSWHRSSPQPVDFDGPVGRMAGPSESWAASGACAYITTDALGVAAETTELFPRDLDVPQGVYDFYRAAGARSGREALWVRLRPPNTSGRCVG